MIYSWTIVSLETVEEQPNAGLGGDALSDYVVKVEWVKTGTEGDKSASVVGFYTQSWSGPIDPSTYVQFADLTKDIVVGWLEAGIEGSLMEQYNDKITKDIEAQGRTTRNVPWS